MTNYNFEEFKEAGGRFRPIISLGEKSGFGLSSGFTHTYDLNGSIGVKLFYDAEKNAVAFKFLKEKESGMVSLKLREKGGYISAQSFIGRFKIDQKRFAGRYEPKEITEEPLGKIYVIELSEGQK
jgi:hypothetical protein